MSRLIRVLHLIAHLGRGGTERQLSLMLRFLDPARVKSTVVVTSPSPNTLWNHQLEDVGVDVVDLSDSPWWLARLMAIEREVDRRSIDLIHSWTLHLNAYGAVAAWLAKCAVLGSLRGSLTSEGWRRLPGIYRWICLHGVHAMVVNAVALQRELVEEGIDVEKIHVLPNAVVVPQPLLDRASCREVLGLPQDALVVGSVGNLRRIKHHELLIDAMVEVRRLQPTAIGVIVGQALASEPGLADELKDRISSLGLDEAVRMVGFREDVADLMPAFDVLALTSYSEGMPNAVLEAMAAERPVAAVRVGGVPELIREGLTGRLVEPPSAVALARAITDLLADRGEIDRMGKEARRLVEARHDPERLACHLADQYQRYIS